MNRFRLLLVMLLGLGAACVPKGPTPPSSLGEAEKKLVEICRTDYQLEPVLFREANTLWVYVPTEIAFFDLKVSEDGPQDPQPPSEARTLYFLDTKFRADDGGKMFSIRYDIGKGKKGAEAPGYGFQYSPAFQNTQRYLLTAVSRAFADVERREDAPGIFQGVEGDVDYANQKENARHKKLVHAYIKTERVPDFFVLVLADIKTGLEAKMYFYLDDLSRGMTDNLFYEEYSRRVMNESATGALAIIGDKTGRHLEPYALTWGEFLAKQLSHRIRFKYAQSDHPPGDDTAAEILKITAQTLSGYGFEDFTAVELNDLAEKKTYLFDKKQLGTYQE